MEFLITGYPKSGNTWLARLLSACLDCSILGWGDAVPVAKQRGDNYRHLVRQIHTIPDSSGSSNRFYTDEHHVNQDSMHQPIIIPIMRHPFDIVLSVRDYWQLSFDDAIKAVSHNLPLLPFSLETYVSLWTTTTLPIIKVSYELLSIDQAKTLKTIFRLAKLSVSDEKIATAISSCSIDKQRESVTMFPDLYAYNTDIQLNLLNVGNPRRHMHEMTINQTVECGKHFNHLVNTIRSKGWTI